MGKSLQAAVFDCDGLLVDSQRCWDRAYELVAADRGRSLDDIRLEALLGASVARAASQLSRDLGGPVDADELRAALAESFAADPPEALPGARELVAELATHMPLAVASNGPRDVVLGVLDQLGMREAFAAVVSAEETAREKPEPHVYLEACRRLAVAPRAAIAFEDSALGAQAARSAGLALVLVPATAAVHVDADLVVMRLDDPRVRAFLGVSRPDRVAPRTAAVVVDDGHATEAPAEV
ncbi:MAG TPA: HAD family phosphatase [Conexibacter sp.]|nr:HAD family phosphatase [Conexibacter sp.]